MTHSRCFIKWKSKVAPVPSSGIEKLETDTFKLQSFQTLTGVKFVITAEAGTPDLGAVLQEIYELYTDYVLKVTIVVFSSFGHILWLPDFWLLVIAEVHPGPPLVPMAAFLVIANEVPSAQLAVFRGMLRIHALAPLALGARMRVTDTVGIKPILSKWDMHLSQIELWS